jgi:hypothetical protein
MAVKVIWKKEKNEWLKANRNLAFEMALAAVEQGLVIEDIPHPQRLNQRLMIIAVGEYLCAVPYVTDGETMFLKTMYLDRKLRAKFRGKTWAS